MKKFTQQLIFFAALLLACAQLQGQATLSVQGSLQNFNGTAVDNGQYDITFKLYTTDSGGTPIWSEVQTVTVTNGVYSVHLGDVNPLNVPFDQTYYLGLTIPGGPEHTPRARLTSSPYALSLQGQDNKFPSTGLVKIESVATGQAATAATSYSVAADDHVIFLDHTANQDITLPAATAANAGRHLVLVNKEAVAKTLTASNYVNLAGATSTTVPATGVVELQSDGSVWRQTGGYVQPATVGKAYVRCNSVNTPIPVGNSTTVIQYAEISDAQNCWNPTTHTFTAPRTGIYRISGSLTVGQGGYIWLGLNNNPNPQSDPIWLGQATASPYNPMIFSSDRAMTAGQTIQINLFTSGSPTTVYGFGANGAGYLTILEN